MVPSMQARDIPAVALLVALVFGTMGLDLLVWCLFVLPVTALGWAAYTWARADRRTRARMPHPHLHL